MKIRNGFVSNSSSSSFIIGIAKVTNKEYIERKVKKINENKKEAEEYGITFVCDTIKNLKESEEHYDLRIGYNFIELESFTGACVSLNRENLYSNDLVLYFEYAGNEGDDAFEDEGEINLNSIYGLEWFEADGKNLNKILNIFNEGDHLENIQLKYGMGRNG